MDISEFCHFSFQAITAFLEVLATADAASALSHIAAVYLSSLSKAEPVDQIILHQIF